MYNDFKQTLRKIAVSGPEPHEPYREFADSLRDEITAREFARMKEERRNYEEYQKYLNAVGASEDPYQMPSTDALSRYGQDDKPVTTARRMKPRRNNSNARVQYNPGVEDMLAQNEALEAAMRDKDAAARAQASAKAARKLDAKKKLNQQAVALRNQPPATTWNELVNTPSLDTLRAMRRGIKYDTKLLGGATSKPTMIEQTWQQLRGVTPKDIVQSYKQLGSDVAAIPGRVGNAIKNSELGQTVAQLENVTPRDFANGVKEISKSVSRGVGNAASSLKAAGKAAGNLVSKGVDSTSNGLKSAGEKAVKGAKALYDTAATGVVDTAKWAAGKKINPNTAPSGPKQQGKPSPTAPITTTNKKVTPSLWDTITKNVGEGYSKARAWVKANPRYAWGIGGALGGSGLGALAFSKNRLLGFIIGALLGGAAGYGGRYLYDKYHKA